MRIQLNVTQTAQSESKTVHTQNDEQEYVLNSKFCPSEYVSELDNNSFPYKERRNLSAQILMIQEAERQRIAKDLHDGLGQSLTLISLGLEECASLLDVHSSSEARASLERQRLKVKAAFVELRRIAMDLRPPMLDDLGILATMSWFFREFGNSCQAIQIVQNISIEENKIPVSIKISIFRILQESFSNILKHASANQISVSFFEKNGRLTLLIEDNGCGFNPFVNGAYISSLNGMGLVSIHERASLSGGDCHIESTLGKGSRIQVSWSSSKQN